VHRVESQQCRPVSIRVNESWITVAVRSTEIYIQPAAVRFTVGKKLSAENSATREPSLAGQGREGFGMH